MKHCKKCNGHIPNRATIGGVARSLQRRSFCLVCSPFGSHNTRNLNKPLTDSRKRYYKWQKKERKRRKQELVRLLGGKCIFCNYDKCYKAMEFDHRDRKAKKFSISGNIMRTWDTVVAEARKCDLVCANCHRERHDED